MSLYADLRIEDLVRGKARMVFDDGHESEPMSRRWPSYAAWLRNRPHVRMELGGLLKRLPTKRRERVLDALDLAALEGRP